MFRHAGPFICRNLPPKFFGLAWSSWEDYGMNHCMCTARTHAHSLVAWPSKLDHRGMQTTEVIQASTAPFLAIAPMPGAPAKPYRDRLLRLSDVQFLTGLGRSSIYAAIAQGTFPSAVNVTDHAVAWRESEVDAWIAARTKTSAAAAAPAPTTRCRPSDTPKSKISTAAARRAVKPTAKPATKPPSNTKRSRP